MRGFSNRSLLEGSARTVDQPTSDVADGPTPATQRESTETKTQYHQASLNSTLILGRLQLSYYELCAILSLVFYRLAWSSGCSIWQLCRYSPQVSGSFSSTPPTLSGSRVRCSERCWSRGFEGEEPPE